MSRSFSCGSRTVRRRQPRERVARPERARHEAAPQERLGDGRCPRPAMPKSTSRKFVTLAARRPSRTRGALRRDAPARRRRGPGWRRGSCRRGAPRSRPSRTPSRPSRAAGTGSIRSMTSGCGDREADPQARQRIRLARRPHDDRGSGYAVAAARRRRAGELGVGLVEDDDRRLAPAARAASASRPVEEALDRAGRLGERRSGCSGCTATRRRPRGRPPGPRRRRAPSPRRRRPARHGDDLCAALLGERRGTSRRSGRGPRPRPRERGRPSRRGRGSRPPPRRRASSSSRTPYRAAAAAVEPAVVRRRVLGQGRVEATGREQLPDERRRGGRGVQVEPDDRLAAGRRSAPRPPRRSPPRRTRWAAVGELNVTGVGLIAGAVVRLGIEPGVDRVAVGEEALGFGQGDRPCRGSPRGPSRSMRWTCMNLPYASTASAPDERARPPVGSTWLAPVA